MTFKMVSKIFCYLPVLRELKSTLQLWMFQCHWHWSIHSCRVDSKFNWLMWSSWERVVSLLSRFSSNLSLTGHSICWSSHLYAKHLFSLKIPTGYLPVYIHFTSINMEMFGRKTINRSSRLQFHKHLLLVILSVRVLLVDVMVLFKVLSCPSELWLNGWYRDQVERRSGLRGSQKCGSIEGRISFSLVEMKLSACCNSF